MTNGAAWSQLRILRDWNIRHFPANVKEAKLFYHRFANYNTGED
jgi:hypothetical protein